ncbi:MAG: Lrp/AsnC family transcriptional regulator [Granulosicoccus sp.]|jgi:Lrp/AsnC family transcriptional regulator
MDKYDRLILQKLQIDASQSIEQLATDVNLSRNACWRRIKAMEGTGLIKQRVALLDADKAGLGLLVFVHIKTNEHSAKWLQKFSQIVKDTPAIIGAHRMSGELDYVLRVRVGSVKDYDVFYQNLTKRITVAQVSASFVMENIKDTTELPI